ncbi:hypothetical protein DCAR_0935863 [Daucus carota subsp. sativus]|uniref:F-box domain-containing protein n=1 Tax=Daucus carota subsp. sativus TaxID=79200 RepID=A0AAF1BH61_DAUCS|nr:PREDICTED: uncharacterized protein LOC108200878 [Daucus carota subsp. sativus]WOH16312.1 hypothetical protein DCAR_0935863 [Daucus carota subsp. sativus]
MRSHISTLPDSMLAEILKRLSLKTLLICRSVQKSWYHFLQTPHFTNLHFTYQQINLNKYLLFKDIFENHVLSLRYDDEKCKESRVKPEIPPALSAKHEKLKLLSSFGLICLHCDATSFPRCVKYAFFDIYLWNPIVRKLKRVPDVPGIPARLFSSRIYWRNLAFGYVPEINDYVVVAIISFNDGDVSYDDDDHDDYDGLRYSNNTFSVVKREARSLFICVYRLSTNLWKKIIRKDEYPFGEIDTSFEPVVVNGTAIWRMMYGIPDLLYYDTMEDLLGIIRVPTEAYNRRWSNLIPPPMALLGQSIVCFNKDLDFQESGLYIWTLKEGDKRRRKLKNVHSRGEMYFWEKKICVGLEESARLDFVGSRNNGELIFPKLYQCHLVSYNVEKGEVNDFVQFWYKWFSHGIARGKNHYGFEDRKLDIIAVPFSVHPFVESLVLLDGDSL